MKRLALLALAAAVAVAFLLSRGERPGAPADIPAGGPVTLVWARGKDAIRLDPADITDGESVKVVTQIFDTLVAYRDGSTEVAPAIAERWETSEDGRTWTFHLREGLRFHDGTPVDADAVVFSFARQIDPSHPAHTGDFIYARDIFADLERVERAGEAAVRFVLREPSAPFLANLATFTASVMSPAAFERHGRAIAEHPVGSGPFVFTRWERDERIVLSANPDWRGGRPAIDRLIIRTVPDNTARFLLLTDGKVHLADGLAFPHLAALETDPRLVFLEIPGMNVAYLAFQTQKPPFDDARVRRAVAHALDLAGIARELYHGRAVVAASPLPPTVWGHNEALRARERNLDEARRLLREAGIPSGTRVELSAFANPRPYMPEPAKLAVAIQSALRQIGLDCRVALRDWAEHLDRTQQGQHEMCLLGWSGDNGDPDNFLYTLLSKANAVAPASNVSFYSSEAAHERLATARRTSDPAERKRLYEEAQMIIHADCPLVPLVHTTQGMAATRGLSGFALHPVGLVRLDRARLE